LAIAATAKWSGTSHQTRLNFVETRKYLTLHQITPKRDLSIILEKEVVSQGLIAIRGLPASNTDPAKTSENTGSNFHHSHHETSAKILVF
jgi:hypothetical protein